jgi:N-terminal domain of anti-restriction factor ArdC
MNDLSTRRAEALNRAQNPRSIANITTVYAAAAERGLQDAEPGVNVLTFEAWKGLGRYVRKGEKALCKLTTWVPMTKKADDGEADDIGKRPRTVAVFHISQTEARS